ncbi:MAG: ankyrin repeat domain-containing protein [Candidatus Avelusimicrobium sp.]|uniref:ankyrin repeat domain-containing protein n=1 Tax=Candidatus Avelusimicrobium sp. TaxID=3048833 RepID=UPI003F107C13
MFANYPLWLQIVCWGVFMGLNGYVGGTLPFANLAVLGFMGVLGFKHGGWFLALACFVCLAELAWVILANFAGGMSAIPKSYSFLATGAGVINILIGLAVFFVLMARAKPLLPGPVWVTIGFMTVCYLLGLGFSVSLWNPVFGLLVVIPLAFMCIPGMVTIGTVAGGLFLVLLAVVGVKFTFDNFREYREYRVRRQIRTAVELKDMERLKTLISGNLQVSSDLLTEAAVFGNMDMLRLLVESGAKINTEARAGLLYKASLQEDGQMLRFLLQQGKNWSSDALGNALYSACAMECLDNVKQLIAAGANVNWQNDWLQTALMETGNIEVAKLLFANGADVTAKDEDDKTALSYYLQRNRSTEMIAFLLEHGADVNARDKNGKTALEYAIQNHNEAAINLLKQYGAKE